MPKGILTYKFWDGASLAATIHSRPISMNLLDNAGITLNTSAVTANTGSFIVEATDDEVFNFDGSAKSSGVTWIDIGVPAMTLANVNAGFAPNVNQFPWKYLRVSFTPAGGTPNGTVVGILQGKGL